MECTEQSRYVSQLSTYCADNLRDCHSYEVTT